ncbi:hypothetical protein BH23ACT5_BH23ACT5_14140 [soil metagenome]
MSTRARTWLLVAAGGSTVLLVVSVVGVAITPVPLAPNIYILGQLAFPVVGGLVAAKDPANLVGRLMVLVGVGNAIGSAAQTYLWMSLDASLPYSAPSAWLATWVWWPAFLLMMLAVAIFPSGRLASAWLRPVLWVGAVTTTVLTATLMVLPVPVNNIYFAEDVRNPWGIEALAPLAPVSDALPVLASVVTAIVATDLVVRWRRSQGVERLQMRWVGLGLLTIALLATLGTIAQAVGLTEVLLVALWLGLGALPTAIGIAVTRYRLYDIDRLLSRTISYSVIVGALALVFATVAIGLPQALRLGSSDLLVAAATLTVAALFNPLRRRAQSIVDRRFNRARYDAQREAERFAQRLHHQLSISDLADEVLGVVTKTVQPTTATVWIRQDH